MFHREQFEKSLLGIGVSPHHDAFARLEDAYGETARHYHGKRHVSECLRALNRFAHLAERPHEIEIAIWFHDAVYDTQRSDNEEQSAAWATSYLQNEGAQPGVVARIAEMILATRSHAATDQDTGLMLDIDLGILGQPEEIFEAYDQAIRREYHWVPEAQYRNGRAEILRGFLDRPYIYHTAELRSAFESQARRNIRAKLDELLS